MNQHNLEIQKNIYRTLKTRAQSFQELTPSLRKCQQELDRLASRNFEIIDFRDLLLKIHQSRITYLGDFHTYDQNIKNLIRVFKSLHKVKEPIFIGLEFISIEHQHILDAFVEGQITEFEFLEGINYTESWRFPWSHYKVIFDEIRKFSFKPIALNSEGSLIQRDKKAAKKLARILNQTPNSKALVFFGEYHLLSDRLPLFVSEITGRRKYCIIHQNLDQSYWNFVEKFGVPKRTQTLKFSTREYCILSSPPWMKYESVCYWYESLTSDPDYDIHEYILENGYKTFSGETYETFEYLLGHLKKVFPKDFFKKSSMAFNLYDHRKVNFIIRKIRALKDKDLKNFYLDQLNQNKSFHIVGTSLIYCGNYSLNKITKLAGQFLANQILFSNLSNWEQVKKNKRFDTFCLSYFTSYLAAKIVNPFIKCDLYLDIKKISNQDNHPLQTQYLKSLDVLNTQCLNNENLENWTDRDIAGLAELIGELMADYFYLNITPENSARRMKELKQILTKPPIFKVYFKKLVPDNRYKLQRKRVL